MARQVIRRRCIQSAGCLLRDSENQTTAEYIEKAWTAQWVVCLHAYQLTSHLSTFDIQGYLFATDGTVLEILRKFQQPINSLTFSVETIVLPGQMAEFMEKEKFILSSIIDKCCSFGISTDVPVETVDIQERNKKKIAKLQARLDELNNKISTEKYMKKAKSHVKERDLCQVRNIDIYAQYNWIEWCALMNDNFYFRSAKLKHK